MFLAVTLVLTYPISRHPGTTSLGSDADVHTFTWTLAWDVHALIERPWSIFNANIFYPYDRTLAFSENLLGSTLFAAPVIWVSKNPVLAMNVVSLASCVLCGLGVYTLGRRIGLHPAAAIVAGLVFAFSPARFFRFAQTHLTTIQWMPFALASLHAYFRDGRPRSLRCAAVFFTLQAFTSLHGAVFLSLAGIVVAVVHAGWSPRRAFADFGVPGLIAVLPVGLLFPPYLRVQREMGLVRTLENWAPSPESFLASPTHVHSWLLAQLSSAPINARASAFLFPGYVPLVLAGLALLPARDRPFRRETLAYVAVTVVAVLLSIGPPLSIWPLVYWLPGLNFIRIPSRFFLLAVLGIAVLAGIGFARLTIAAPPRARRRTTALVGAMFLVEASAFPLAVTPYRVELSSLDRWLDTQPKPFAVAEVPVGPSVRYHSTYMLHSMAHWQKTVHGHSSLLPALHERLYDQLRSFPDEASVRALRDLGVNYIVVHIDGYPRGEWDGLAARLEQYRGVLQLGHEEPAGRVYALAPP